MLQTRNEGVVMKTLLTSFSMLILLSTATVAGAQTSTSTPTAPRPIGTAGATAAAGAADTTATKLPPVSADYRLVTGDKLRVEVYKDAQLSQSVQVRPDGKITLPLANDVMAAGRTPTELRDAIVSSLKTYVSNPTVTVIVVETVPPVIYVMGEVNTPGPQPLTGKVDVLQALATAGGFKDFAKTKDIKIRRGSQVLRFNYNDAVKGKVIPVYLQPGDMIIVP
jgi:polysaccharide biosynthesis/export protein